MAAHKLEARWTICGGFLKNACGFGGPASQLSPLVAECSDLALCETRVVAVHAATKCGSLSAPKYVFVQSSDEACRRAQKQSIVTRDAR